MIRLASTSLLTVSFLHLLLFVSTIHSILCIDKEKHALLDFKLSFVDDPLGSFSNWRIDNIDCCTWDGVICDAHTGHVISLYPIYGLKSYRLRPSLLELQHLTALDLSHNHFPMKIPKFIGSLTNLTSLDLSDSEFFGEIPPQLGNLSKLQFLHLSDSNGLYSDNLHWLSRLSSIVSLDLSYINFSNAIDWVSSLHMLPALWDFTCRSCFLPQPPLPSTVSYVNSTSLQFLDLSNSSTSSSAFSYLVNGTYNLERLYLDYMKLDNSNIHEFLGAVINGKSTYFLQELSLARNNLSIMPFEVAMFPSLMYLDLSFNRISGSLAEILQSLTSNLTSLDVSSNLLNSTVISDTHFSKFSLLHELRLSGNNLLTLNFSKSWVPPFQLLTLELRSCKVGPSFPNWILTQKRLWTLDISNSMISGAIPDAFWEFSTRLSLFNLSHNKINCKIPNLSLSLVNYTDIFIDLSYNSFRGDIPLFLFTALTLDLSYNRFTSFPTLQFGTPNLGLKLINLSGNRLSGSLPDWLFLITSLSVLDLSNNKLSGTLPAEIGSQQEFSVLHLNNNNFSGELPLSMRNCTHLTILELASNKFTGAVPFWIGESMTNLISLTLRSNNFVGELPSSLCHLQSLQIFDLSDNQISGCIPRCLHNFTTMSINIHVNTANEGGGQLPTFYNGEDSIYRDYTSITWKGSFAEIYFQNLYQRNVINLSGNLLRGEIPAEVTTLKQLRSLDLSRNSLNGSIPDKIGQLTSLEVLLLSSNILSGEIPESMASLTFLDKLNLSNNNLSGRIPTGTQLQSFSASSYTGNPKLCGEPLPTMCPGDEDVNKNQPPSSKNAHVEEDESFDIQVFLAALGMGFAVTFLGVLGILHFIHPWRLAFFQLSENIADRIFVATSLFSSRIKGRLCPER